jgi:hypothetical protein
MKGRAIRMRSVVLAVVGFLFPLAILGCAGVGASQQPRLEIPESAGRLMVRPQGLFFSPHLVTLDRRADGSVTVHALSGSTSRPGLRWLNQGALTEDDLAQLNDALIPFLVPACGPPTR